MKIARLLALSLGTTACLTIGLTPAMGQSKAPVSPKTIASVQKKNPLSVIIQREMALLKRAQTSSSEEQMNRLYQELLLDARAVHQRAGMKDFSVPSMVTTLYFGDVYQAYPKSGLLAILFAESLADQSNDFGQIAPIYEDAIKVNPNHPLLAQHYADYLKKHQGTKRGTAVLMQALQNQPQNPNAYFRLASFQPDDSGAVLKVFDRAIAAFPKNPSVYTQLVQIALDRKYSGRALTQVTDRIIAGQKALPQRTELYVVLAVLYQQAKQPQLAINTLQQGLVQGGDAKVFNLLLAEFQFQNKQPDLALNAYRQVLKAGGNLCYEEFGSRSIDLQTLGKVKETFELLSESLRKNASTAESLETCGRHLYILADKHSEFRQATIDVFRPIVTVSKAPSPDGIFAMMSLMMKENQYAEAIQVGQTFSVQQPQRSIGILSLMGNAAKELKDFAQAERLYLKSEAIAAKQHKSKIMPDLKHPEMLSGVRWQIGTLRQAQGQTAQAIEQFNLALEAWPSSDNIGENDTEVSFKAIAHNSLGEIYQAQGNLTEARSHFESAIRENNTYGAPKQNLAKLH